MATLRDRILRQSSPIAKDPALFRTFAFALDELEVALVVPLRAGSPHRDVMDVLIWLWAVSDTLVPLLKQDQPEAIVVFAHFCVLLKHHEAVWWLRGWGDHLIRRAYEVLDEKHRDWIRWPVEEVGIIL